MILLAVPLPVENPFPIKLSKHVPVFVDGYAVILTGIGAQSARSVAAAVESVQSVSRIIEIGGAAVISPEQQGNLFEAKTVLDASFSPFYRCNNLTALPKADIITVDSVVNQAQLHRYAHDQSIRLITMETAHIATVAIEKGIPFSSLRIATDSGETDRRKRFITTMEQQRKTVRHILEKMKYER